MVSDEVLTYAEVARLLDPEIVGAIEQALGWPSPHGTVAGYRRERIRGELPCLACRAAAGRAARIARVLT